MASTRQQKKPRAQSSIALLEDFGESWLKLKAHERREPKMRDLDKPNIGEVYKKWELKFSELHGVVIQLDNAVIARAMQLAKSKRKRKR